MKHEEKAGIAPGGSTPGQFNALLLNSEPANRARVITQANIRAA